MKSQDTLVAKLNKVIKTALDTTVEERESYVPFQLHSLTPFYRDASSEIYGVHTGVCLAIPGAKANAYPGVIAVFQKVFVDGDGRPVAADKIAEPDICRQVTGIFVKDRFVTIPDDLVAEVKISITLCTGNTLFHN